MRLPDRIERVDVPVGYEGTLATLRLMSKAVREGYLHPRLRWRTRTLFAGLTPHDHDEEIAAIWRHVVDNVRFQRDPVGTEHITLPAELDQEVDEGLAAEDCESMIVYAAALLAAAGLPSYFEIIGWDPSQPRRFRHVALQVRNPMTDRLVSFDPVAAQKYPGHELGDTLWRRGLPRKLFDLDGKEVPMRDVFLAPQQTLAGLAFGDTQSDAEAIAGKILGGATGFLSQLGPYGQLAGGIITVGGVVYEAATGRKLGQVVDPNNLPPGIVPGVGPQPDGTYRSKGRDKYKNVTTQLRAGVTQGRALAATTSPADPGPSSSGGDGGGLLGKAVIGLGIAKVLGVL